MSSPTEVAATVRLPRSQRRAQLLLAARDVFAARGYHAAAMDEIAEKAGVSKPVLYQHFPGKLDLYLALVDEQAAELIRRVQEGIESSEDNKSRVVATLAAYFDFVDMDGEAFRLIFESDLRAEPAAADRVAKAIETCIDAITDVIRADTEADEQHARLLAVGLAGAAEMAARRWLDSDRAIPKSEAVAVLSGLIWRGISSFPRHG